MATTKKIKTGSKPKARKKITDKQVCEVLHEAYRGMRKGKWCSGMLEFQGENGKWTFCALGHVQRAIVGYDEESGLKSMRGNTRLFDRCRDVLDRTANDLFNDTMVGVNDNIGLNEARKVYRKAMEDLGC